jgi:hypothetical protein
MDFGDLSKYVNRCVESDCFVDIAKHRLSFLGLVKSNIFKGVTMVEI